MHVYSVFLLQQHQVLQRHRKIFEAGLSRCAADENLSIGRLKIVTFCKHSSDIVQVSSDIVTFRFPFYQLYRLPALLELYGTKSLEIFIFVNTLMNFINNTMITCIHTGT